MEPKLERALKLTFEKFANFFNVRWNQWEFKEYTLGARARPRSKVHAEFRATAVPYATPVDSFATEADNRCRMPSSAMLNLRPTVSADQGPILEMLRAYRLGEPWCDADTYATGFAETIRQSAASTVMPTDPFSSGRRPGQDDGRLLAIVAVRKIPCIAHGWRFEADIVGIPDLGPAQVRACETEARRLARKLSARRLQISWFPKGGPLREDRVVRVVSGHGLTRHS